MKKHIFSLRKPEATSITRTMAFNRPKFLGSNIYNADELGLSYVPSKLPSIVSPKRARHISRVVSAERSRNVTIICAAALQSPIFFDFKCFLENE